MATPTMLCRSTRKKLIHDGGHLMHRLWENVLKPILTEVEPKKVVEIGVKEGENTEHLLKYCEENNAELISIDPYKSEKINNYIDNPKFCFFQDISLNVLSKISDYDVILIDGDHNWYTVYHELKLIEKNCEDFPLVVLHDIGWPYGRRDLYYNPDLVPENFLNPYKRAGLKKGVSNLIEDGLNSHLNNSIYENNFRNGVLTAVEDFISESSLDLELYTIPAYHGIGFVFSRKYSKIVHMFEDININLLEQLECNRIEDLLTINQQKKEMKSIEKKHLKVTNEYTILENEIKSLVQQNLELKNLLQKYEEKLKIQESEKELLIKQKEDISNEKVNFQEKYNELTNKVHLITKENDSLKNIIENKDQEINIHINSIKYQLGNETVKLFYKPSTVFTFPKKVWNLYKLGKKKKDHPRKGLDSPTNLINKSLETNNKKTDFDIVNEIGIVICVHNALEDFKNCIVSLYSKKTLPFHLVVVDDGSNNETKRFLQKSSLKYGFELITNEMSKGYTIAANQGINALSAKYIVLLNSDTIVTYKWLEKLIECMESDESNGIVGPLSNAASWQSVPKLKEGDDWCLNPLNGLTVEQMANIVQISTEKKFPEVPLINGFCYMISKKVIDAIGNLDDQTFPRGYGEEDDFSIRASEAGFKLRVADNCYVYHQKSKSFTPEGRKRLITTSKQSLFKKHSKEKIQIAVNLLSNNIYLENLRNTISNNMNLYKSDSKNEILENKRIAVYTAIFGDYDELEDPLMKVDGVDYICFTNNPKLMSSIWEIRYLDGEP